MSSNKPFVSVVLCCYNGADVLPDALQALTVQKYSGEFEIIVVDDGSSDSTYEVAKSFKDVRVIRNKQNKGLAGSRNVGIKAAKGEIVAFTDDDCRPHDNWIQQLVAGYTKQVSGVGGEVESAPPDNVVLRYLDESKPLKPLENTLATSKKLTYRLGLYLKGLAGKLPKPQSGKRSVYSLVGANMSFRKEVLEAVGLFDEKFRFGGEEEDLCKRIDELRPGTLYFNPDAKISHQYERSLRDTLRRSQAYGKGSARMFRKHKDINPVIYPFPPVIVASALLGLVHPALFAVPFVAIPFIYLRWLLLALSRRSPEAILYAYIQFLQEIYGTIGFIKGWWQFRNLFKQQTEARVKAKGVLFTLRKRGIFAAFGVLIVAWNVLQLTDNPAQAIVSLLVIGFLPGLLLLLGFRVMFHRVTDFFYMIAVSLGLLLVTSLALNALAAITDGGITLGTAAFVIALDSLLVALLIFAYRRTAPTLIYTVTVLSLPAVALGLFLVSLPFGAIIAANYLNATGNNILSLVVLGVIALTAVATALRANKIPNSAVAAILFSMGLSVLLLSALRGEFIGGTDVSKEFYLYQLTLQAGHWTPSLYHDAYNACLSITALPVLFSKLLKVDDLMLFRVIIPAIYAAIPIMIFAITRRWAPRLIAFLAAFIFIAQPVFVTWSLLPVRQIFATLFFGGMLLAIFDRRVARWLRIALIMLFGVSMILSHYSTSYLALGFLVLMYAIQLTNYGITYRRMPWQHPEKFTPSIALPLIGVLIAVAALWYGPITHAGGNITSRADKVAHELREGNWHKLFADAHSDEASIVDQFMLSDQKPSQQELWNEYLERTDDKIHGSGVQPMQSKADSGAIDLYDAELLSSNMPDIVAAAGSAFGQVVSKLLRVFLIVGLGVFLIRFFRGNQQREGYRAAALAGGIILVAIMVVPYASIDYDLVRTAQQLMLVLALPTILGGVWLIWLMTRNRFRERYVTGTIAGVLIMFFVFMSGLLPQVIGTGQPLMSLNNYGNQYNQLYVHEGEVAAASWLRHNKQSNVPIYAGYFGGSRLQLAGIDRSSWHNDILPWTIDRKAYVYASYAETARDTATTYYRGSFIPYNYPDDALTNKKDVLYSNGQATIYK